jgi:hypothetical protein
MLDTDELDPNYKPVSHEERTANEKQKNKVNDEKGFNRLCKLM